jgi:hypothetical protein
MKIVLSLAAALLFLTVTAFAGILFAAAYLVGCPPEEMFS